MTALATDSLFPTADRVQYLKTPLHEVICRIDFPSILRIEADPPSDFQERIRDLFPEYGKEIEQISNLPPELAVVSQGKAIQNTIHNFVTDDKKWKIAISSRFLSLSTKSYSRWNEFRTRFELAYTSLLDIYKPSSISRLGLRYTDVVRLNKLLSLPTAPPRSDWSKYLQPQVGGSLFNESSIADSLESAQTDLTFNLSGPHKLRLSHGLAEHNDHLTNHKEECYMLDFDFYANARFGVDDVLQNADRYNAISKGAFRWCITDELHRILDPKPITD